MPVSHFCLFRHLQRVVELDAEVADRAFNPGVTQQELDSPQVLGAPVDQRLNDALVRRMECVP